MKTITAVAGGSLTGLLVIQFGQRDVLSILTLVTGMGVIGIAMALTKKGRAVGIYVVPSFIVATIILEVTVL